MSSEAAEGSEAFKHVMGPREIERTLVLVPSRLASVVGGRARYPDDKRVEENKQDGFEDSMRCNNVRDGQRTESKRRQAETDRRCDLRFDRSQVSAARRIVTFGSFRESRMLKMRPSRYSVEPCVSSANDQGRTRSGTS